MKKILTILSIMVLFLGIRNVNALDLKQKGSSTNTIYGTVKVMETDGWEEKPNGGYYIRQTYSFSKTLGGYIYVTLLETDNVKVDINSITVSSNFELVKKEVVTMNLDGVETSGVDVVLKLKDGSSIDASSYAFEVMADIVDSSVKHCALNYSPRNLACLAIEDSGVYFDDHGNNVSREEHLQACENYVPEEPEDLPNSPQTGSFVPYIAIGVGIVLIGTIFYYIRKSSKFYKI